MKQRTFNTLKGKTLVKAFYSEDECTVELHCSDGARYRLFHYQECSEEVFIKDEGEKEDLQGLIGSEILFAEEESDGGIERDCGQTFEHSQYTLRTHQGMWTVVFEGMSNGYYSTSAELYEITEGDWT